LYFTRAWYVQHCFDVPNEREKRDESIPLAKREAVDAHLVGEFGGLALRK